LYVTHNQGVAGSSPAGPTLKNQPLTKKISKWFFISRQVYARFTPGFGQNGVFL